MAPARRELQTLPQPGRWPVRPSVPCSCVSLHVFRPLADHSAQVFAVAHAKAAIDRHSLPGNQCDLPLGQFCSPEDIAGAAVHLASDATTATSREAQRACHLLDRTGYAKSANGCQ